MRIAALVVCLLLTASVTAAVTYKWEDAKGVHFSDDLGDVPGELRARALPEDENEVITFGKPIPFNSSSALRQKSLQESERLDKERDRIVMEGIRQHQEEMINRMSRDRSALQAYFVRLFAHRAVIWIAPLLLLLYFWVLTLIEIMGREFTVPAHKYRWLVVVLFLAPFGMVAYYLRGRPGVVPAPAPDSGKTGFLTRFSARMKRRRQRSG